MIRRLLSTILFLTACFTPVFASASVDVKSFGAKGDGVSDDTRAIQDAIESCRAEGGEIVFPAGTYLISSLLFDTDNSSISSSLHVYSGQTLRFEKGAVLRRGDASVNHILFTHNEPDAEGYDGCRDISIVGAVVDENASLGTNCTAFNVSHAQEVRISDCEFYGASGSWHSIEINSSRYVYVRNCFFHDNSNSEDLQIDAALGTGNLGKDDEMVCRDIYITDNHFRSDGHPAIGNHNRGEHRLIYIYHNIFEGTAGEREFISFHDDTYNVHLSGNIFKVIEGTATGYEQPSPETFVFSTDGSRKMLLHFCSPSVVKVYNSFDGEFSAEAPTPAVVSDAIASVSPVIAEEGGSWRISTGDIDVIVDKAPLRVSFSRPDGSSLLADATDAYSIDGSQISCTKVFDTDEHIFGLGEKTGLLDRRGSFLTMWNSDKPCYCNHEDPLYKSIPFFMSSKGYGIYFDNSYKSHFDFRGSDTYTFGADGGEMIYYFIAGGSYKDVLGQYIKLTGRPVMPPRWSLGFSQCCGNYVNQNQAIDIATKFREIGFPCDIIYQDIGWTQRLQNFEWNGSYTDPEGMTSKLKDMGFHVIVSQDPIVSQSNTAQWAEADSLDIFVKDDRTGKFYDMPWPWGGRCGLIDFSNPAAASWWGDYQQKPIDDGVAGFWTDMGEPAWSNEEVLDRLHIQHYAGPHAKMHNLYGLYWDKVVTEEFEKRNPGKRLFQMTRSAFAGMQRYCFSWTGDSGNDLGLTYSWDQFAYQIPVMLSASVSGVPFITGDITGYCGDIPDYSAAAEIYIRWMQFGLFTPLSRAHHWGGTQVEPWKFGDEAVDCARKVVEIKYALMPYLYTCAREAYDTGTPIMRAMFLEFPDDPECARLDFQFMFGPSILVAPVVEEGARTRRLYLPEGEWYDWYTEELYEGGRYIETPAPLDKVPLFVRAGSIIPTVAARQYTWENPDAPLYVDVWPSSAGSFEYTLYEDDGESLDYKADGCARTKFSARVKGSSCTVSKGKRTVSGGYSADGFKDIQYRLHGASGKSPVKKLIVK